MTPDNPQLPAPADHQAHDTQDTEPGTTAAAVDTPIAPRIEHYGEGQIVRGPGGRFLPGTTSPNPITRENAQARSQARRDKKRQALLAGAQRATSDILQRPVAHESEWIEVLAEANMHRAANPGNLKGVDASRFLLQEAGLSEPRHAPTEAQANESVLASFGREGLAALLAEYRRRRDDAGG